MAGVLRRDPRVDPQPGDRLRRDGKIRRVGNVDLGPDGYGVCYRIRVKWRPKTARGFIVERYIDTSIENWRRWAKNAEVLGV